ncbi:OLC1v1036293C1 [Oldenlandia corymbosa var. corymbosa]|uniref:OLC1v1036293C1 n=1 Tax=Oldenlandia corymbosa var. corymbosa TaxID=529605 RepID=A0AAV1CVT4_OLDCO|nr:OLC1v1036293C1 [Oldenlandia corymbosa var. corymbosa]
MAHMNSSENSVPLLPSSYKMEAEQIESQQQPRKRKKRGGAKITACILAVEACDKLTASGFQANMITYLTKYLNLPLVKASNIITIFTGTSNFTPLVGALFADSFAGRFRTILVGSIVYVLGMITITITAFMPSFRPPPCPTQQNCKEASTLQMGILYIALLLQCIGTGGIRPCVVSFGADQLDMSKAKVEARKWNLFNWYYLSLGMATLLALTVLVYVQDNVDWGWGLGIPTIALSLSILLFVLVSPLYIKKKPQGSPFTRLAQVIVAAFRKRDFPAPNDPALLYQNKELDASISVNGRLQHTNQFRWLDRAAIVTEADKDIWNTPKAWRLSTVHRVEELKSMVRILPIWGAAILLFASYASQHNFAVLQGRTMDRHFAGSLSIPPASLTIFGVAGLIIGIAFYERLFVPCVRRFTHIPTGITHLQRIGIGLALNIFVSIISAVVEIKRKQVAADHGLIEKPNAVIPISVFWLSPQFFLHGIGEVFMQVGLMEFIYDQSPESMKSTAIALYSLALSLGNYLGTSLVAFVHDHTGKEGNWLPDRNLNKGKLDYYFWLMTGIQVVNFIYYVICAWHYTYKPLEMLNENESEVSSS